MLVAGRLLSLFVYVASERALILPPNQKDL